MRGQMIADNVQRCNDALVRFQIEEELPVIGYNVLQLFDVRGRRLMLGFLCAFGELEPLLQAPQIVVDLLPVALRAQRTCKATGIAVNNGRIGILDTGIQVRRVEW